MLVVTQIEDDTLQVKCKYHIDYVKGFRQIPGRYFNKQDKVWEIPTCTLKRFEKIFPGQIIYKTPRWKILKQPMPDYSKMYVINDKSIRTPVMKCKPFKYQDYGIRYLIDRLHTSRFMIDGDGVGLGKTPVAIGVLKWFFEHKHYHKFVVITKKALKQQWHDEFIKFTDLDSAMPIIALKGTAAQRKKVYTDFAKLKSGVLIINHHTPINDLAYLLKLGFDMVIEDEAHLTKTIDTAVNTNISKLCDVAKKVLFLTGTPLLSKPEDLFGIIHKADKKFFSSFKEFKKRYIKSEFKGSYTDDIGVYHIDELRDMVQEVLMRRTENEVDIELPAVRIKNVYVDTDKTQNKCYEELAKITNSIRSFADELEGKKFQTDATKKKAMILKNSLKGYIACKQIIANDPNVVLRSRSKNMVKKFVDVIAKSYKMSPKTEMFLDIIEEILNAGEKVIVFSKYETVVFYLRDIIKKVLKVEALTFTGSDNDNERDDILHTFVHDDDINIIIATTALECGFNGQIARNVINFEQPAHPDALTQRVGRVRRIGSKYKRVFMYNLLTNGTCDIDQVEKLKKQYDLFVGLVDLDIAQSKTLRKTMEK